MKLRKKQKCAALLLVCCILFQTTYYCVVRPNVVYATGAIGSAAAGAAGGAAFLTGPETALIIAGLFGVTYTIEHADDLCKTMKAAGNAAVTAAGAAAGAATDAAAVVEDWWRAAAAGAVDTTSSVWKGICNWFVGTRENYYNTAHVVNCSAGTAYKILNTSYSCTTDTLAVPYFVAGGTGKYKDVWVGVAFFSNTYFKVAKDAFVSEYDSDSGLYYKLINQHSQTTDMDFTLKQLTNDNISLYGDLSFCYEDTYDGMSLKLMEYLRTLVSSRDEAINNISGGIDKALDVTNIDDINFPDTITLNRQAIDELADSVADSVAEAIDNLATGAWTWTEYLEKVASGTRVGAKTAEGVYTLDDAGVTDVPYEKDATDAPPAADTDTPALNDNLADYKTDGLTSLFPFCIPFDLINCIKLMSATGEAPCWEFPFQVPVLGLQENIKIDLAKWDSVAALSRSIETLLFIGLLISRTREFIRG